MSERWQPKKEFLEGADMTLEQGRRYTRQQRVRGKIQRALETLALAGGIVGASWGIGKIIDRLTQRNPDKPNQTQYISKEALDSLSEIELKQLEQEADELERVAKQVVENNKNNNL